MVVKQDREIKSLQELLFKKEREVNDMIRSQGTPNIRPSPENDSGLNNHEIQKENGKILQQNNTPISPQKTKSPLFLKRSGQESPDEPPKKLAKDVPEINPKQLRSKTDKNSLCPLCNEKSYGLMVSSCLQDLKQYRKYAVLVGVNTILLAFAGILWIKYEVRNQKNFSK